MIYVLLPWIVIGLIYSSVLFGEYVLPRIKNRIDIYSKGKYNKLADTYICILAHIIEKPEEWKIDKDDIKFPREGRATKIHISREDDCIEISQDSIGNGDYVKVKGYFQKEFLKVMDNGYKNQSMLSMMNALYPDDVLKIENHTQSSGINPTIDLNNNELFRNTLHNSKENVFARKD